jgi:protease-4
MRQPLLFLLLTLIGAGCSAFPIQVVTHDHIRVENPVVSKVITDTPPVSDAGPVVAQPVGGYGPGEARVALVDVDGLLLNHDFTGPYSLGENPVALFHERLEAVAADPCVGAVVLRINSPGGGVTASDVMRHELLRFRERTHRPVVACLMDVGAGGAYYLATACDQIVAHPTTVTGGIGVILNLYNLRELMNQYNVTPQTIKSGQHIDLGTTNRLLSEEGKKLLQAMADQFHQRFQQAVRQARPQVDLAGDTTFDGRVFTAEQALERRLIDGIGYLDDAVTVARELAHLPAGARVVLFHRGNDPARSPYAVTPNVPLQGAAPLFPSLPGLDRSRMPTFLYLWEPDATLERLSGR